MSELKDKVAFITGAAHGQGRAAALALAKEGVHIIAFDIAKAMKYPRCYKKTVKRLVCVVLLPPVMYATIKTLQPL